MDGAAAAWQREGVDMTQEEFKTMMDELNAAEIERLGVGSREFQERHQEIMDMIGGRGQAPPKRRRCVGQK